MIFYNKNVYKIFIVSILMSGCSPSFIYNASTEEQLIFWEDGYPVTISEREGSLVFFTCERLDAKVVRMFIGVKNIDSIAVNLVPGKVMVSGSQGRKFNAIYDQNRHGRKLNNKLSFGLLAYYSIQNPDSKYISDTYFAGLKSESDQYNANKVFRDKFKKQQIMYQSAVRSNNISVISQEFLTETTLFPGDYVEGSVMVKVDDSFADILRVVVPVGEDVHEFFVYKGH